MSQGMLQRHNLALESLIWASQLQRIAIALQEENGERITPISHHGQVCKGCLLLKQFKKTFPKDSSSRAQNPLELIHTDVCGPIKPSSLSKSNYFLLFIDDFSRKTWVFSEGEIISV